MKKRLLALLLCVVMACALLVPAFPTAAAAEATETDKEIRLSCTDTCVAVINKETGALTFEGDGDMVQGYDMKVRFSDYSDYIRKVTLKAGMFEIPSGAFENCTRLESVNLFSASAIYENAFKNCSSLKDIKITGNVNYISGSAFAGCISLTKFDLSKYNTFYKIDEAGALYRDTKLIRYPAGRTGSYEVRAMTREIGEGAFEGSLVHDVALPDSLYRIDERAFADCPNLTGLTIPKSTVNIERCISLGSPNFRGFQVEPNNRFYSTDSYGGLYTTKNLSGNLEFKECPGGFRGKYVLQDGTRIVNGFHEHDGVTEIWMPDSVLEVYYSDGCKNLSKVRLSKNLLTIDSSAFRDCAALREVVIPESVKTIGERAFSGCISLKHVYFMGDLPEIGWLSFADSNAISDFAAIPGMVFYYREGTSGWGPTVFDQTLSYPTAVWTTAPYTDASPDSWYASAVRYTYDNGLMNGTGEYSFEPESSMTRAMLVTVLWRYAGQPQAAANPFTDVPGGEWYTQAVAWAAENGVVNGIGGGKFDPNRTAISPGSRWRRSCSAMRRRLALRPRSVLICPASRMRTPCRIMPAMPCAGLWRRASSAAAANTTAAIGSSRREAPPAHRSRRSSCATLKTLQNREKERLRPGFGAQPLCMVCVVWSEGHSIKPQPSVFMLYEGAFTQSDLVQSWPAAPAGRG